MPRARAARDIAAGAARFPSHRQAALLGKARGNRILLERRWIDIRNIVNLRATLTETAGGTSVACVTGVAPLQMIVLVFVQVMANLFLLLVAVWLIGSLATGTFPMSELLPAMWITLMLAALGPGLAIWLRRKAKRDGDILYDALRTPAQSGRMISSPARSGDCSAARRFELVQARVRVGRHRHLHGLRQRQAGAVMVAPDTRAACISPRCMTCRRKVVGVSAAFGKTIIAPCAARCCGRRNPSSSACRQS